MNRVRTDAAVQLEQRTAMSAESDGKTAATDSGLRRETECHAAFRMITDARKAVSWLRSATAVQIFTACARTIRIAIQVILLLAFTLPGRAASTRVPPPGIAIAEKDRAELRAGADVLAREIASLRSSARSDLLPDVEIYHKAVDWALRYDEFYRSNEVGSARTLLKQGMERAKQLRDGHPSWLTATGLVVRGYVSKIDGSVQPYGLVVPGTFATEPDKARRLDVWLHGRDNNLTELKFISDRQRSYGEFTPADTFMLHPYGRYCNAFKFAGEADVFEALEHVKKSYPIDNRRIALRGFSMGGAGVWHLAAHHPRVWAVAAPGAGFAETAEYQKLGANRAKIPSWEQKLWQLYDATDYAANFFNLPVIAYNGTDDPQRQAADVMERAMKAEGLKLPRIWGTNVGHKYTPEGKREVSQFVDEAVAAGKGAFPKTIRFTTRTLRFNRARHLRVDELIKPWARAEIVVTTAANDSLEIQTRNISAFSLFGIKDAPHWLQSGVRIDGRLAPASAIGFANPSGMEISFRRGINGDWNSAALPLQKNGTSNQADPAPDKALHKLHGLQGPIDDAFMDSFLIVRPTGQPQNAQVGAWMTGALAKATNDWRAQFRGDARVKDDSQVTDADIAAHNLVLFGDPKSNKLLARIANKLPIQWSAQTVKAGGKSFPAATHVPVFIFPNPLNPQRYVVLNSGFTFAAASAGSNAQQTPKLPDYAVLDVTTDSAVLADFFDEQWQLR
jgi:predicted esterase